MSSAMSRRLSDLLLLQGVVGDDLGRATDEQHATGGRSPRCCCASSCSRPPSSTGCGRLLGLDYVDLSEHPGRPQRGRAVPEAMARRHILLPIGFTNTGVLLVAMSDPSKVLAIDDARNLTDLEIQAVVAAPTDIAVRVRQRAVLPHGRCGGGRLRGCRRRGRRSCVSRGCVPGRALL